MAAERHLRATARGRPEAGLTAGEVEELPAGEGIEPGILTGNTDKEVPWHADGFEGDARPAADLDGQHGQGDGDPEAARHHSMEEGVLGVVIVAGVPPEAELDEQTVAQGAEIGEPRCVPVELGEPARRFDPGVAGRSDQQRRLGKVDARLGQGRQLCEATERLHTGSHRRIV